jgi:hypothetical protein
MMGHAIKSEHDNEVVAPRSHKLISTRIFRQVGKYNL